MKRFLPLFILTGLLFGQDVLYLKSGELKKGVFIEKIDNDIVFQIEGESKYTRFSIDLVEIIETNNRAIFYPFDIPTKKDNPSFGQDILNLKSGESFEGTFLEKLGRDIIFKAVGDTTTKKYPIWNIETIETMNWGELTYPFDIPTKEIISFDSNILPKNIVSKQEIKNMSYEEKGLLYGKYKVSPLGNTAISFIVPTLGYHRINQWKKRGLSCISICIVCVGVIQLAVNVNNEINKSSSYETEWRRKHIKDEDAIGLSFVQGYRALYLFDVYTQTKKYNRNVYKYIFGEEE
jgi:hypothetical protein